MEYHFYWYRSLTNILPNPLELFVMLIEVKYMLAEYEIVVSLRCKQTEIFISLKCEGN